MVADQEVGLDEDMLARPYVGLDAAQELEPAAHRLIDRRLVVLPATDEGDTRGRRADRGR